MLIAQTIRKIINPLGIDLERYPPTPERNLIKLFQYYDINLVFDIGANKGQYALSLIKAGYVGKMVSFEPLRDPFGKLKVTASHYKNWEVVNVALGSHCGREEMNVSKNLVSSSILEITGISTNAAEGSNYVGKEIIEMTTLDNVLGRCKSKHDRLFVKIDVQGFEKQVLDGAIDSLDKIIGLQLELSLSELYKGQTLYKEMIEYLQNKGFIMVYLDPQFYDPKSGRLLQMDGVFFSEKEINDL